MLFCLPVLLPPRCAVERECARLAASALSEMWRVLRRVSKAGLPKLPFHDGSFVAVSQDDRRDVAAGPEAGYTPASTFVAARPRPLFSRQADSYGTSDTGRAQPEHRESARRTPSSRSARDSPSLCNEDDPARPQPDACSVFSLRTGDDQAIAVNAGIDPAAASHTRLMYLAPLYHSVDVDSCA